MTSDPGASLDLERAADHVSSLNEMGRHEQALALGARALAATPDHVELLLQTGVAYLGLGRADDAREHLQRAAAAAPWSPRVQWLLSAACLRQGSVSDGLRAAEEGVRLLPSHPHSHLALSRALVRCGSSHAAVEAALHAVSLAPDDADAQAQVAAALYPPGSTPSKDQLRRAEVHLLRALALEPADATTVNDLARVRLALGRPVEAIGGFASAAATDPRMRVAQDNLARALGALLPRAHWVLFLVWLVTHRVLGQWAGASGGALRTGSIVCAAAGLGVIGWVVSRLAAVVPARHRSVFLRGFAKRDPLGAVWALCLAVSAVMFLVGALLPGDPAHPSDGLVLAAVGPLFLGAVTSWVRVLRHRRRLRRNPPGA